MRAYRGLFAIFAVLVPSLVPVVADHSPAGAAVTPRLTVGDVSVAEGDAGKIVVRVPIDLDVVTTAKMYVYWKITGGSATPRVDFSSTSTGVRIGKSTIAAKKTEAFVSVTIYGDTVPEPDETVNIDVTSVSGANISRGRGTLTIQNDDGQLGTGARAALSATPRLSIGSPSVAEGNSGIRHAPVPLILSEPAPAPITISYDTPGSDDVSTGEDCHDATGVTVPVTTMTHTFKTGQQSASISVPVRGNMSVDQTVRSIEDSIAVVSGSATVDQPTSDIVLIDDDTAPPPPVEPSPGTYRASEPPDGSNPTFQPSAAKLIGCGYPASGGAAISADGRFVAFSSNADDLTGNDSNGYTDVFVKDTWTGAVELASAAADGTPANNDSYAPTISADGRFVLFNSQADNLVPGDVDHQGDSFLYDRTTGAMQALGNTGTMYQGTTDGSISADDRYVTFSSDEPLTGGCVCNSVFVFDRTTNVTSLVSTGPTGQLFNAGWPAISADGRHVAFITNVSGASEAYVKDLDTGNLEMVSVNAAGQPGTGVYGTYPARPALSSDGQIVAFNGQYCNMGLPSTICHDGPDVYIAQVWIRDRVAGTTTVGSLSATGTPIYMETNPPSLTPDGRYVLFDTDQVSWLPPECAATPSGGQHVYRRDRSTGAVVRVDLVSSGPYPCPVSSWAGSNQAMSADGSAIAYSSLLDEYVSSSNPEAVYVTRLG